MTSTPRKSNSTLSNTKPTSMQPDLLAPPAGSKPIDQQWATAEQLHPFTGMDEAKLRRLGKEINPATQKPWLPKPVNSKWPAAPTLIGVIAYLRALFAQTPGERRLA